MPPFRKQIEVCWSDIDGNKHMRHTAYADHCSHVRFSWLAANDFGLEQFAAHNLGAVLTREWTEYFREAKLGQYLDVDVKLAGCNADISKWSLRQEILHSNGKRAARHQVHGTWLDLTTRKVVAPPPVLLGIFQALPRTKDFEEMR